MMDCKQALTEAKGDMEQAVVLLRKRGVSVAAKKATRVTSEGAVESYIHAGGKIGVLVEVNCESDFVARTEDFKELIHDVAMHIAASDPKFIRKEDVTQADFEREKDIYLAQAMASGKNLEGKPLELVNRALKVDPQNAKALQLAGSAAFQAKYYKKAIDYWQRVLKQVPTGSEVERAINERIEEAKRLDTGK